MSTESPWKTLDSRVAYRNDWITVREDRVIRPDGNEGIYGVVESRTATGAAAMTPSGELYLVGQFRYALGEYSWEIIEGGAEPGEDPLEAAKRELREEAGLEAMQWEPLGGEITLSNCHSSERAYLYLATDLREVEAAPEGTEVLQVRKMPLNEAIALADAGEIKDAMTLIALARLERKLRAG
jgi:8-oxo-dGTP pyrophosphatase MutT (NUDIX family)